MRQIITVVCLLLLTLGLEAQEINSKVTINTPKLQTTDPRVFRTLEQSITEFLNNTRWSEDLYESNERINLTININIQEELNSNTFSANFYVQASRPIFNSNQSTAILEHNDKDLVFRYEEFQPLEFTDNIFNSNLTSFLAFYAYVTLGLDYDTFSREGGDPYFQAAQDIINTIPTSLNAAFQQGWRSLDGLRNRYWILESILSPRTADMRQAMYEYHRLGLDQMVDQPEAAREYIFQAINKIKNVNQAYPNAMIVQMFVNAKSDEIVGIFSQGTSQQKRDVYATMVRVDAANANKYREIRK